MATIELDRIGVELMRSVEGDEIRINNTKMEIKSTGYYTGVTGTGDTVPHLFKFRAIDTENERYVGEIRWDMTDGDPLINEALFREAGGFRYENIDSIDVLNRVDHPNRPTEGHLMDLYEEAKEEYEDRQSD